MNILDYLNLPILPRYLQFKNSPNHSFPINNLTDKEIKQLYKKMAEETIKRKHEPKNTLTTLTKE